MPWRPRPHELPWLALAVLLALSALVYAFIHCLGDLIMKRFATCAALAAAALTLCACATPGKLEAAAAAPAVEGATAQERLEILKEVNRHIELCDRTYAWPLAATWVCKSRQDTSELAAQIGKMVKDAVAEALKAAP